MALDWSVPTWVQASWLEPAAQQPPPAGAPGPHPALAALADPGVAVVQSAPSAGQRDLDSSEPVKVDSMCLGCIEVGPTSSLLPMKAGPRALCTQLGPELRRGAPGILPLDPLLVGSTSRPAAPTSCPPCLVGFLS